MKKNAQLLLLGIFLLCLPACSIKNYALGKVADAMTSQGGGYGTDDDPELVAQAAPFGLKTMEQLAESLPKNKPLRLSLSKGFVQYTYGFIQPEYEELKNIVDNLPGTTPEQVAERDRIQAKTEETRFRMRRLFLRARNYALDGLELSYKGVKSVFLGYEQNKWAEFLAKMKKEDVPYLYWTAAAWGLAISNAKDVPKLTSDLGIVNKIMKRAYELDEAYDEGALHMFFLSASLDTSAQGLAEAVSHKDRALALSQGKKLSVFVSYAENILVPQGDKKQFVEVLNKVLETDIDSEDPSWRNNRLENIIAQKKAKRLLAKQSEFFLE